MPENQTTREWQPIETAPTPSLLDAFSGPVVELKWEARGGLTALGYFGKDRPTWITLPHHLPCGERPTHWRPLDNEPFTYE